MSILYENNAFSILVLSTKKIYCSFLKKGFRFRENLFQSKRSTVTQKHADLSN